MPIICLIPTNHVKPLVAMGPHEKLQKHIHLYLYLNLTLCSIIASHHLVIRRFLAS
jgi:hypothetical protein